MLLIYREKSRETLRARQLRVMDSDDQGGSPSRAVEGITIPRRGYSCRSDSMLPVPPTRRLTAAMLASTEVMTLRTRWSACGAIADFPAARKAALSAPVAFASACLQAHVFIWE